MNPAEQAAYAFCSTLFADPDALAGYEVTLLVLGQDKRVREVRWLPVDPAAIARAIVEANTAGGTGAVYLSAALARPGTPHRKPDGRTRRMENPDIGALVAVWVDLDLASPAHETDKALPPDRDAIDAILKAGGLPPSATVDSGHGVHCYWQLHEPLIFADEPDPAAAYKRAAAVARDWQRTLAIHAHRLGRWQIDATHDFSRVLRVPGSTNRKLAGDFRAVKMIHSDETIRYELDDIAEHLADPEVLGQFTALADYDPSKAISAETLHALWRVVRSREYRERDYRPEWLEYALDSGTLSDTDPLVKVWREGHKSGDASSADASLARLAANLGLTERDAAELVMCYRLRTKHRIEKVDPNRRVDYLQRTVARMFASARQAEEEVKARQAEVADALRRQNEALDARRAAGIVASPPSGTTAATVDPVEAAVDTGSLGQVTAAALAERANVTTPAPVVKQEAPPLPPDTSGDVSASDPLPDTPTPGSDIESLAPPLDIPAPLPVADTPPLAPVVAPVVAPVGNSVWGTRTADKAAELDALSKALFGDQFPRVRIWRLFTRGKGARAERFLQVRFARDWVWADRGPDGYHPGAPFHTGPYPAAAFNKVGGWVTALRVDAQVLTNKIGAEEFATRFGDTLVRYWEPDDTGGALASVVHDALYAYLLDFPPVPSMNDGVAQGMPVIVQDDPRWALDSPFTVLVRWGDFCRFVKGQYGLNITPPVMAEMADLAGAIVAPTQTQEGRWRQVRRDYFTDTQWAAILHGGHVAEQQRDDRHSMRALPGGRADEPTGGHVPGSREAR